MSSYNNKHYTIRTIDLLYSGDKVIHKKAQYLGFYKRIFNFFQNVHPNVKALSYQMMRSKDNVLTGSKYFVPRRYKTNIEQVIKFGYRIQALKSRWLRDDWIETDSYEEMLCHLFVADNVDFPNHFCDLELLNDDNYLEFFCKVGQGDKIWKWLPKLPFELNNQELHYFLTDTRSFKTSIWSGVYYATLANMVEDRTDYQWLIRNLVNFRLRKSAHREDLLLFLIRNFNGQSQRFSVVMSNLKKLLPYKSHWQGGLKDLDLSEYSDDEIYGVLVEKIFVKYSLHKNVYKLFCLDNPRHFKWFLHLAKGFNLRSIPDFIYKLSKSEARFFFDCKGDNLTEAYYYSKVMAAGGTDWQANYFAKHIMKNRPNDSGILQKMIAFLIKEFPKGHDLIVGIIRYILLRYREKGGFSIKGRTAKSISKDTIAFYKNWLKRLNREYTIENLHYFMCSTPYTVLLKELQVWNTVKIAGYNNERYASRYEIRQINSVLELEAEGRVMHHCVASYAHKCKQGSCSIWTFSKYNAENRRRRILTVEVVNHKIVQAKGNRNSGDIESKDYSILMEWAKKANLNLNADKLSLKVS